MKILAVTLLASALLSTGAAQAGEADASAQLSGIAAYGRDLYQARCSNCHSDKAGENSLAPTLHQLFGRKAGGIEGFPYSEKIKMLELVWQKDSFEAWIGSQSLDSPILRMRHLGVNEPGDQQALSAYIDTLK